MIYPTAKELESMGAALTRDVDFCTPELRRWFGRAHVASVRVERAAEPRRVVAWPRKRAGKRIA